MNLKEDIKRNGLISQLVQKVSKLEKFVREHKALYHAKGLIGNITITGNLDVTGDVSATTVDTDILNVGGGGDISNAGQSVYNYASTSITNVNVKSNISDTSYLRLGNQCIVSGEINIRANATGLVEVDITLPFPSNFSATNQCVGSITRQADVFPAGVVSCDTTTMAARLKYIATATETGGQRKFSFWFSYRILP